MHFLCSNILSLTNHFEIGDQNMTLDNYEQMLGYLNSTKLEEVAKLELRSCNLQKFLDQVLTHQYIINTDGNIQ